MFRRLSLCAALVLIVDSAWADTIRDCYQTADSGLEVSACTGLIDGGTLGGLALAKVYTGRGVGYGRQGDYERAIADHARAITLAPDFALAYSNRGSALIGKGDFTAAIADFDKAIGLDPSNAGALNGRAWARFKLGRAADALADAEAALALKPGRPALLDTRAHVLEALGQRDRAIADYRAALAGDPSLKESREGLDRLGATP